MSDLRLEEAYEVFLYSTRIGILEFRASATIYPVRSSVSET